MLELIKSILRFESDELVKFRSRKEKIIARPTTIISLAFILMYILSAIDLIPEYFIKSIIAYIDDGIAFAIAIIFIIIEIFDIDVTLLKKDKQEVEDKDDRLE